MKEIKHGCRTNSDEIRAEKAFEGRWIKIEETRVYYVHYADVDKEKENCR